MIEKTYCLYTLEYFMCLMDGYNPYHIKFNGKPINGVVTSKNMPFVRLESIGGTSGDNNVAVLNINMLDKAALKMYSHNLCMNLGINMNSLQVESCTFVFGVAQGASSINVLAQYKWYPNRKAVSYEYTLYPSCTLIRKGDATIKDKCIESYIKHFMKLMASVDISNMG